MATDPEDIAAMEMPHMCACGEWLELPDGYRCGICKDVFCSECVQEPFGLCPVCAPEYEEPECWEN